MHYRAPPDIRGSGKERGHGTELTHCPKCGKSLKPGKHHVGCSAGKSAPRQASKRSRLSTEVPESLEPSVKEEAEAAGPQAKKEAAPPQDNLEAAPSATLDNVLPSSFIPSAPNPYLSLHSPHPTPNFSQGAMFQPEFSMAACYGGYAQVPPALPHMGHHFASPFMPHAYHPMHHHPLQLAQLQYLSMHPVPPQAPLEPFAHQNSLSSNPTPKEELPTIVSDMDLANVFDYDREEDMDRIPSPPPLPPDFHPEAPPGPAPTPSGSLLFNFGQFDKKMPHNPQQLVPLPKADSAIDEAVADLWKPDIAFDHQSEGDLMQLLFGAPDQYPTMATIHVHQYEQEDSPLIEQHSQAFDDDSCLLSKHDGGLEVDSGLLDLTEDLTSHGRKAHSPPPDISGNSHQSSETGVGAPQLEGQGQTDKARALSLEAAHSKVDVNGVMAPFSHCHDQSPILSNGIAIDSDLYSLLQSCE